MKKLGFSIFIIFFVLGLEYVYLYYQDHGEEKIYVKVQDSNLLEDGEEVDFDSIDNKEILADEIYNDKSEKKEIIIPKKLNLNVLFSTQAPTKDWGMPYQEACEEASLIMAFHYFANMNLNRSIMNREILDLVDWENKYLGHYTDTNLAEVQQIAERYFGLETQITNDVSIDNIKYLLNQNYLILMPFAGRLLENPYFSGEGPLYHMLVIKGYDSKYIITNDPGLLTKGENFKYTYKNIEESVHDWNGGNVYEGPRIMLVVKGLKKEEN